MSVDYFEARKVGSTNEVNPVISVLVRGNVFVRREVEDAHPAIGMGVCLRDPVYLAMMMRVIVSWLNSNAV